MNKKNMKKVKTSKTLQEQPKKTRVIECNKFQKLFKETDSGSEKD